jgi:D-glycero-alpha-D-manno-heptose-7-phosphate kinase
LIIVRSPLRITLGGGGTDLASYYERFGGFFISAAIDQYVYVSLAEPYAPGISLKYTSQEYVDLVSKIKHPLIRAALSEHYPDTKNIELYSFADLPGGTGLGSSGAFGVALLKALHEHNDRGSVNAAKIAEQAHELEAIRLQESAGKQDPFASAIGGLTSFTISTSGKVESQSVITPEGFLPHLERHLHLYFTGISRVSSEVMRLQDAESRSGSLVMLNSLHQTKELGYRALEALRVGSIEDLALLFNSQWDQKVARNPDSVTESINSLRNLGLSSGALGAKLIGAGGGGFLLFVANPGSNFASEMRQSGYRKVPFKIAPDGLERIV